MRTILFLLISGCFIACNSTDKRDEKIHAAIVDTVSSVLQKTEREFLDSVSVTSIDSLTEKMYYTYCLEEKVKLQTDYRNDYLRDSLTVAQHRRTIALYRSWGDAPPSYIDEKEDKTALDKSIADTLKAKNRTDSVRKLFEHADANKHWGYYVQGKAYYRAKSEHHSTRIVVYVDNDYKVKGFGDYSLFAIMLTTSLSQ